MSNDVRASFDILLIVSEFDSLAPFRDFIHFRYFGHGVLRWSINGLCHTSKMS